MSVTADLSAAVALWDQTGDLTTYVQAIGQMFAEVESYALDTDTVIGWSPLWDVDNAPSNALPWLAMVVGERVPAGSTDTQARALIRAAPNQDRGQPLAVVNAVKQVLTGGKIIGLRERARSDGTADNDALSVFTYTSQTPSVAAVQAALARTVPADINIYYQTLTGPTWTSLETGESWSSLESTYGPTWANVESSTPGYVIYGS